MLFYYLCPHILSHRIEADRLTANYYFHYRFICYKLENIFALLTNDLVFAMCVFKISAGAV